MSSFLSTIGRCLSRAKNPQIALAQSRAVHQSLTVSSGGEGKGGGAGGSIRSSGGSLGKRSQVLEEQFIRRQQAEQLKELHDTLEAMKTAKIEYHEKQLKRHLEQIKKHEELMEKDHDASHKVYISSHKESAEAHQQYLAKLNKAFDDVGKEPIE